MFEFLSVEDVLILHADQIEQYGGDPGVRDIGLLESAVAQPRATFDGVMLHVDIYEMAAAYHFHLVMNHPFIDGNKRAGAIAALVFLDLNGLELDAPEGALADLTLATASGQASKAQIADFFRKHCSPIK